MTDLESVQEALCRKYNAGFSPSALNKVVGISKNFGGSEKPINGLRHSTTETSTGWFLWAGEYSDRKDFFEPVHMEHVIKRYPEVVPYLGLSPGWRFLIDPDQDYEDVWRDNNLILDE